MYPSEEKLIAARATAVMLDARRIPACRETARKWLRLAGKYTARSGMAHLAEHIIRCERSI